MKTGKWVIPNTSTWFFFWSDTPQNLAKHLTAQFQVLANYILLVFQAQP